MFHDFSRMHSGCIDTWILWSCLFMYYDPGLPLKQVGFGRASALPNLQELARKRLEEDLAQQLAQVDGKGEWNMKLGPENRPSCSKTRTGVRLLSWSVAVLKDVICRVFFDSCTETCLVYIMFLWMAYSIVLVVLEHLERWQDSGGKVFSIQCKKISILESCDYVGVRARNNIYIS